MISSLKEQGVIQPSGIQGLKDHFVIMVSAAVKLPEEDSKPSRFVETHLIPELRFTLLLVSTKRFHFTHSISNASRQQLNSLLMLLPRSLLSQF